MPNDLNDALRIVEKVTLARLSASGQEAQDRNGTNSTCGDQLSATAAHLARRCATRHSVTCLEAYAMHMHLKDGPASFAPAHLRLKHQRTLINLIAIAASQAHCELHRLFERQFGQQNLERALVHERLRFLFF